MELKVEASWHTQFNPIWSSDKVKSPHGQPMCTISSLQWIFSSIPSL